MSSNFWIAAGLFVATGMIDYSLFHNNQGGQWLIAQVDPLLQNIFNAVGISGLGTSAEFAEAATGAAGLGVNADGSLNLVTGP
ncbi:MAG: hypothetical protein K9G62_03570 [Alphaproteobacteria bacterium]|nr:hypothetical protein [Alphaproteobacteria bacterium]